LRQNESDPTALAKACAEHITRVVSRFKGRLIHWDVVNEPFSNHDLMDILGDDIIFEWFRLAREADPDCKLFLNDYGIFDGSGVESAHQKHFERTLKRLIDHGGLVDGIGIQSHFGSALPPPEQLIRVLDHYAKLGLPIESTEVSINLDDTQLQADYLRDYMTAVFSHPSVDGIMLWGFWEGRHWMPKASLYNKDWTIKPIGQTWIELTQKQWTTDAEVTTDSTGVATLRGFLGHYKIDTVDGSTHYGQLESGGTEIVIQVNR
jgi:GH35 family endo-1,4-beta-xylanase